jgi:Organic solute transporter Ostalpha
VVLEKEVANGCCREFNLQSCLLYLQIVNHLRNYTEPIFQVGPCTRCFTASLFFTHSCAHLIFTLTQRYIVRILAMVPVYAICSWLSLVVENGHVYFEAFRVW